MFDVRGFEGLTPQCVGRVHYARVMESTSDEARRAIGAGEAISGSLYLAEYQTNGRGRGGNSWVCPEGEGLLFSLVVDPDEPEAVWYRMSLAVGVGIVEVLGDMGVEAELKWPNDIYVGGRKLGGILIEKVDDLLVVGVGLNVNVRDFSDDVAGRAVSLFGVLGEAVNREVLLSRVVVAIYRYGSLIGGGFARVVELARGSFYLMGRDLRMISHGECIEGRAVGISDEGYLELDVGGELVGVVQAHGVEVL